LNDSNERPYRHVLLLLPFLIAAWLAAPASDAFAQATNDGQARGAVTDASSELEHAIATVRALHFDRDFHHGAAVGDAALERWPESSELAAWTLASLARTRIMPVGSTYSSMHADEALSRAEALVAANPDDVWATIALAFTLNYVRERRAEALEASLRALEMAPTMPEAVWVRGFVLHSQRQYADAIALIEEKWPVVNWQWPELLTVQGNAHRNMPERQSEGLEILARVRELDPANVNAHYLAGTALLGDRQRIGEARSLLERAAELSPGSIDVADFLWRAIQADPAVDAEEKKARISASAGEVIERRGQYPGVLRLAAARIGFMGLPEEADALHERLQSEFAHTADAEWMLSDRWQRLNWRISDGQVEDTVAARTELSTILWSFIGRPHHYQPELLGNAYAGLFHHLRRDEAVSPDTLLLLARRAVEHSVFLPHAELALGLAERGVHLDAARELARSGIGEVDEHLAGLRENFDTPQGAADYRDMLMANHYAAIGYIEVKAGDLSAAREAIDRALELKPDDPRVQLRAGAVSEAEGDLEAAEIYYASGERYERLWPGQDGPNRRALERLFSRHEGAFESLDEFIAAIGERDRARRQQRVADSRIQEPRALPAIDLEWLHGGRIAAEELEGRIVVINFWGVWCPPCVAEAPQIQQLHEKYREDPGVAFLTINAFDPDLEEVRTWMAEHDYDFPVLIDDNFATPHGVRSYPTTWFADANGRIVFEYSGASAAVFEEFVWRIEMLQEEAMTSSQSTHAPPHAGAAPLSPAAAQVLHLLDQMVYDEAMELGATLVQEYPDDPALHALYAFGLAESNLRKEARNVSEEQLTRWPDDPWAQVARGYLLLFTPHVEESLAAAGRARQLAPEDPAIARYVMRILRVHNRAQDAIDLADTFIASGHATTGLRVEKADVLSYMRSRLGILDTTAASLEKAEIERALSEEPPSAALYYAAAERLLQDGKPQEAFSLVERAVELSPLSSQIRQGYWRVIGGRTDLTAEERQARVEADIDAWLAMRHDAPGARLAVAQYYGSIRNFERSNEMTDGIQRHHSGTWWAAQAAFDQAMRSWMVARQEATDHADSTAATQQLLDRLRTIASMPGANSRVLGSVYTRLFWILEEDSTTTADDLLSVFERLEEHSASSSMSTRHVALPAALAERGSRLDLAEQLAREGLAPLQIDLEWWRSLYTADEQAQQQDRVRSNYHSTIGWVLFHKGDIEEAKRELETAHEILNTAPNPPYRLGRIAEAEGDLEAAERWYAAVLVPRSREALKRLYLLRNESLEDFDAYLAVINERDIARRRALVEAQRIAEPKPLPAFEHEWMNGGRFNSDSLRGKIAVIYFWGVWCGPCVHSAPNTQAFAEKFRDHPDVVFLTVANDTNPETTRGFMKERGYDFPVIFDEGLVQMANIWVFPTTLFVDREGNIVFNYIGSGPRLVDDYTWRVEALLGSTIAETAMESSAF
jgi:tetratricopeptide (TPR) repeat protein